jgi:hypothetical protein
MKIRSVPELDCRRHARLKKRHGQSKVFQAAHELPFKKWILLVK